MFASMLARLSQRKLLIASSIVAIRNFASHADEYGAALRQFYFAVHPDFFGQYPFEKETNENSLKVLNDFMSGVNAKHEVKPTTVEFFLRENTKLSEAQDNSINANGKFHKVEIQLKSKHLPTLIHDILSSCHLPIHKDLENLVKSKINLVQKPKKIQWSPLLKNFIDEENIEKEANSNVDTLYTWLINNIENARHRTEKVKPFLEENRRISKRIIRRHRLKSFVAKDTGYSQVALNGALRQLEFLFRRRSVNTRELNGKTLKIGQFNGLDQLGRFIVDIADIPTSWIQALSNLGDLDGLLHVLDLEEMQISELLWGVRIYRGRKHEPVPIRFYYKQVSKLLQTVRETFDHNALISSNLEKVRGRITRASDNLCISEDGSIIIPCMSTFDAISSFVRLNYSHIVEARKTHARSLQVEVNSMNTCSEKLKLCSLTKDKVVTSDQMIKSCERLKREDLSCLEQMPLIISNYYAISGDGEIRIPWNWKI